MSSASARFIWRNCRGLQLACRRSKSPSTVFTYDFHSSSNYYNNNNNNNNNKKATLLSHSVQNTTGARGFWFSSSASPQPSEKEANQAADVQETTGENNNTFTNVDTAETKGEGKASENIEDAGSDTESDLSIDDLVKLVSEKEDLLKVKQEEIENIKDKVLRSYAEIENVMARTKREAENSKKFAVQNFAKSLLDVADNLGRASTVVKDSFSKIDPSKDTVGAVPLLKTLLEGVEMTDKQLEEVFRKYGVEKFDPMNEQFDPNRHQAVFQISDSSKPAGTITAVMKPGYILHDRVIRPADVGVTDAPNNETGQTSSSETDQTSNNETSDKPSAA